MAESIAIVDAFASIGDLQAATQIMSVAPNSTLQTLQSMCIYRSIQRQGGIQWIPKMERELSPWIDAIRLASNLRKYATADAIVESCLERLPNAKDDAMYMLARQAALNGDIEIAIAAFVKSGLPQNQAVRDAISLSKKRNPALNDLPSITWRRAINAVFASTGIRPPRIDDRQGLDRAIDKCMTDFEKIAVWVGWGLGAGKMNDEKRVQESIEAINQIGKNNHRLWRSVRPVLAYLYTRNRDEKSLRSLAVFDGEFSSMHVVQKHGSEEAIVAGLMQLGDIETAIAVISSAPFDTKSLVVFAEVGVNKFHPNELVRWSRNLEKRAHIIATAQVISAFSERDLEKSREKSLWGQEASPGSD
ncbi:hypothetical protein [Planctomycetes bacterium CA13]